jgi:hypothetical protein
MSKVATDGHRTTFHYWKEVNIHNLKKKSIEFHSDTSIGRCIHFLKEMLQYSLLKLHYFASPVYHTNKNICCIRQSGMEGIVLLVNVLQHYW